MKSKKIITCSILAFTLIAPRIAQGATIAGFGDGSAFTKNTNVAGSNADITAGTLTLTTASGSQARSVYATTKQDITSFTTTFRYQNGNGTSGGGADGFTFIIQNAGITALGPSGGSLGYSANTSGGAGIGMSVAVAFRIFNNDNTSVASNGTMNAQNLLAGADTIPTNLLNLADISITYSGTNLSYTVTNPNNTTQTITRNVDVDIANIVGGNTAFIGFTGGTGGTSALQTISNFSFVSPIPEPSTALLGALSVMTLLLHRRRA